jgi:CheY-like chemotaxis protein
MTEHGRVLLVEDNEVDRLVASALLARLGFAVDIAGDGDRALDLLAAGTYDAVLLDCGLPGRTGREVVAELRRRGHRVPVIALTGSAGDAVPGMDEVLAKPVTLAGLAGALGRWTGATPPVDGPTGAPVERPSGGPAYGGALDPDRLAELRDPDPAGYTELLAELAGSFLTRGAAMLARLADAVRREDAAAVERDAHSLAGSAGNLGAARLAELAAELEGLSRRGELTGAGELLRGMTAEFGHVRRALAELVDER